MKEIRTLNANEIECRVGTINDKGFSILLYKDARVDMNILDETFGSMNWQREHKEIKGNLYCGISIWDEEKSQWITKWDCGIESFSDKEKGESSDAFKRSATNFGIGRELYTSPFIWIKGNVQTNSKGLLVPSYKKMSVSNITYVEGKKEIKDLEIVGDGEVIFTTFKPQQKKIGRDVNEIIQKEMTYDEAKEIKTPRGTRLADCEPKQLEWLIKNKPEYKKPAEIVLQEMTSFIEEEPNDDDLPF